MSVGDFQLIDDATIDNLISKKDFVKVYHQQIIQLNESDKNIEILSGEFIKNYQIGNGYVQFDIQLKKRRWYF